MALSSVCRASSGPSRLTPWLRTPRTSAWFSKKTSQRRLARVPCPPLPFKPADPHSVSSQLDEATSSAIIARLENRAEDAVFQSLFDEYFPDIIGSRRNVLEVGTGTGIVCRRLFHKGYEGRALGVDQSERFIAAARRFSAGEGVDSDRISFAVADARRLGSDMAANVGKPPYDFDAVVMHTLISHVTDPVAVLKAARDIVQPGTKIYLVDGDYPSLAFHYPRDPALGREMQDALVKATFASPEVVRSLPQILAESGWGGSLQVSGKVVSEAGSQFSYWKTFAETYMPRVKDAGLVDKRLVDEWWKNQLQAAADGGLFAACSYYTVTAIAN